MRTQDRAHPCRLRRLGVVSSGLQLLLWLCIPAGLLSVNCGGGFTVGPGADGACRGVEGGGARAVTLLGGARVGYLRAAAPAAPAAFEEDEPMLECGGIKLVGLLRCKASITSESQITAVLFGAITCGAHEVIPQTEQQVPSFSILKGMKHTSGVLFYLSSLIKSRGAAFATISFHGLAASSR